METASLYLILKRWQIVKAVLGTLGAIAVPSSLFVGYHIAKISVCNVNLNILDLERYKHGYAEYIETAHSNIQTRFAYANIDNNYIRGPIWRKVFWKKGPKYWAIISRTSGPIAHTLAIDILSRLHDLPDGVFYSTALACDNRTLIDLARKKGTDIRFFLPPRRCYEEHENLSTHIYRFLRLLPFDLVDDCTRFYSEALMSKTPPIRTHDTDNEEDSTEFTSEITAPRKSDLSPPAQSLASLSYSTLNVIWHHTMVSQQRDDFIYKYGGLQLLTRLWYTFGSDELMMCKLANILLNLSLDKQNHSLLVSGGFLHMLAVCTKSLNNQLKCTAASALANFSSESPSYECGVYLLHPLHKRAVQPELDVVFIHGVNGAAFHTWRQQDCMKASDDYSMCWPMDWLGEEFGSRVRSLGVDYEASATYWESQCTSDGGKLSIDEQAIALADKLCSCQLGGEDRKVVWVGHSLGGLLIKRILALAKDNPRYKSLLENTKGVIFMGVPHRGCPVASLSKRTSYLAFPTIQLQQIADSDSLLHLNNEFIELATNHGIICKNFIEGSSTSITSKIKIHIVPPEYGELEVGENILLEEDNHVTICKPKDRHSRLYQVLVNTLHYFLNEQTTTDQPMESFSLNH